MSRVTFGTIIVRPDDERRSTIRKNLAPLRRRGYERGVFIVELDPERALRVALSAHDLSILKGIDEVLEGIVERNVEALVEASGSVDLDHLLDLAWFVLSPVRSVGYGDGEFSVRLPGGVVVRYEATWWDAMVLQRFDALLDRVAEQNEVALAGPWLQPVDAAA